ncbi:MAG: McrB family protein [Promethearchaeota archaeon]
MKKYSPKEYFPGEKNVWKVENDRNLKLISAYPSFESELQSALDDLLESDDKAKSVHNKINNEIKNRILTEPTYIQFSKWCDWSRKKQEALAKNVSRILFGFDIPRMTLRKDDRNPEVIKQDFLKRIKKTDRLGGKYDNSQEKVTMIENNEDGLNQEEISERYNEYRKEGRIEFITFHPSYSYEEFVEGITVDTGTNKGEEVSNEIRYIRKWGIFKKICTFALASAIDEKIDESKESWNDQWGTIYGKYLEMKEGKSREEVNNEIWANAEKYVLIIDEINRGDISKIFGELVTLLEKDKRLAQENEIVVQLPYSNDEFGVPPNLYIIGTMNTADRSITLLDVALRRRFGFVEMAPDFDILVSEHLEKNREELEKNNVYQHLKNSIEAVSEKVNKRIIEDLGRDKQIGHSFFFKVKNQKDLMMVWQYEILPLLEEYHYCDYDKILGTIGLKKDNPYFNKEIGIKGFEKINELEDFLNEILEKQ